LREDMQPGDLVLAWQVDLKAMSGICEVAKLRRVGGRDPHRPKIELFLLPLRRFSPVVRRGNLPNVRALTAGSRGTLHRTTLAEAKRLLRACGANDYLGRLEAD